MNKLSATYYGELRGKRGPIHVYKSSENNTFILDKFDNILGYSRDYEGLFNSLYNKGEIKLQME